MTDAEISALGAAARAATPGPWKAVGQCVADSDRYVLANCNTNFSKGQVVSNAAYIAAANPAVVLELIAELRQTKAERDWLAENMPNSYSECHCPEGHYKPDCEPEPTAGGKVCYECLLCWLKAAKEAVCQKN